LLDDGPRLDKVTLENRIRNAERAYIGDADGYRQLTGLLDAYAGPKIRVLTRSGPETASHSAATKDRSRLNCDPSRFGALTS